MIKIWSKNSGAYGHTCCGHSIQSDFTKRVVSWPNWSLYHDIKNLKAIHKSSKQSVYVIETGLLCKGLRWSHNLFASGGRGFSPTTREEFADKKKLAEKLWHEFFSDPSQWWDNRVKKVNPRHPDFTHKKTKEALWLDSKFNPAWVEVELTAIPLGTFQLDTYSWNKRLASCYKARNFRKTLDLFYSMQMDGKNPDKYTYVPVLNACSGLGALDEGRKIHLQTIQTGHESDVYVGSCLVDMYAKCGSIEDAWTVFNKMPARDVVAWNAMILGFVKCGQGHKALQLFGRMQREGVNPHPVTFVGVLNACASVGALEEGRHVHEQIIQSSCESDIFVASSLVDMYAKCGSIEDGWRVFKKMSKHNVVSWNSLILGYAKCGLGHKALELFGNMQVEGIDPDPITFVGLLNACACLVLLAEGRHIHEQIIRRGFESNVFVSNSLIDMYSKCGGIEDAWRVFNKMPVHDVVSWNAIILGFMKYGNGQQALQLHRQMQQEGVRPNTSTFVAVLNACACISALEEGRHLHDQIISSGCESNVFVGNGLIDMYAKCGSIEDAREVFYNMPKRNVVSWNAMLGGYAMHGDGKEAIGHFQHMLQEGVAVDEVTFVSLLSACNHGGLLNEGLHYFESMGTVFGIDQTVEHYACIVDLLGRAGWLQEAEELIKIMPCKPDAMVFMSLLSACRLHGNSEIGECIAQQVLELEPENAGSFVTLSNMYTGAEIEMAL